MQDYGIIKKIVDGGESSDDKSRKTYPDFEEGDCFVGLEDELEQLKKEIEGEEHRFISVWGMGGQGKTTIAREVYNQMKRKANSFDRFAWVCISQQCQVDSVLKDVLNQLDPQRSENVSSSQQMVEQLIKIQRAHRCLIVIDDLWKISDWNHFKHAFVVEDLQNKVLVTTRKQNVAETIGFSVKHGNLNMDGAWELEKELKQLVSLIEGEEHRFISVWGMGGLGKTTIAREVYNQMKRKANSFDRFAWVCISQQFKIRSVLEEALKQLDPQRSENASSLQQIQQVVEDLSKLSEDDLIRRLHEIQKAHRCLIVIDDLWNICHWNHFKHAFRAQGLKSKVLVTTRKQVVAETIGFSVKHGNLNMDDAWELLKKKAFPDNNIPEHSQEKLHEIGEKMFGKCGCLPLAICVLGGVLRKTSINDWESVRENMNEYMVKAKGDDEDEYQIRGVLDLSYEDLPYYLKPCFLYLGTLKEDQSVDALVLYRMWIAQGMISSETHGGKQGSLMDIAEIYLSELASRCIVEVKVEDITGREKYRKCKLHDVVREQCLLKGRKEGFGVTFLNLPGGDRRTSLLRYLVIDIASGEVEEGVDELAKEDTYKLHVRSLKLVTNDMEKVEFPAQSIVDFQRFKMLRDLVIVGFEFPGGKFPRGIFTNLVHLRCLRLLKCGLDELPSSISKLVYLETLDLSGSWGVRIPNVLKKMLRLQHLILPYHSDEDDIGSYQLRLDEGLDELESLMGFDSKVHELKCSTIMKNLRRLSADVHDNKSLSVIINALDTNWNKLQFSEVSVQLGCQLTSEEGWMMLKQLFRCRNLHSLRIRVELGKLPVESMNNMISSKLVALYLYGCKIEDDPMGILGNLPFLSDLRLCSRSFVGSSFPRLKTLAFQVLPKLREWRVEAGAMPLLSEIYIFVCLRLEKVPDGLNSISTLQKLEIMFMRELAKRVAPSGEDFAKVSHIPSIITDHFY